MNFVQRTVAPSESDKNFLHYSKGGYNKCILISGSSCLPNCVGYCWGRWRELLGFDPKLSRGNAENWFLYTQDGYKRGQTPKVGAVACYSLGRTGYGADGAGHVAIVEEVHSDGSITVSESNYGWLRWRRVSLKPGYAYNGTKLKFQGFIYLPIDFDDTPSPVTEPVFEVGRNYRMKYTCYVRTGPGKNYRAKKKNELTAYAQKLATSAGCLKKGTVVTCQDARKDSVGNTWIKIPSGWIAAYFENENYLDIAR